MDRNRRTNFISQADGGFEDQPKKYSFASVPNKGANDNSEVKGMIDNLRKEHFKLGEQNSGMFRSSASYGQGVHSATKKEVVPWASMKTNYALGIDKNCTTTDY